MRNDRDDEYKGSDDSEYHYTDEEAHHESDPGSANQSAGSDVTVEKSTKSKRMIISLVAFIVLVGVVYKMVVPSSNQPSLTIANKAPANKFPIQASGENQTPAPAAPASPVMPVQSAPAVVVQQPAAPAAASAAPAAPAQQPNVQGAIQQVMQALPVNPAAATSAQQMMAPQGQPAAGAPAAANPQVSQVMNAAQQMMGQMAPGQAVPGQSASPASPAAQAAPVQFPPINQPSPVMQSIDASSAAMANEGSRMQAANQAEYERRAAEMQSENKNLQDQLQILSSRVALMESQMNQLVQTLTQQYQNTSGQISAPPSSMMPSMPQQAPPQAMPPPGQTQGNAEPVGTAPRVPYNVQAIIPGRAWLRSSTGDTLTVAEGDEIKGVGKVTKIDPYDGLVVIDVKGRPVTLSYGSST